MIESKVIVLGETKIEDKSLDFALIVSCNDDDGNHSKLTQLHQYSNIAR